MTEKQAELKDWRADAGVLTAQRERDAAAAAVAECEAEHRKLRATAAAAEQAVEVVMARLQRGECGLGEVSKCKSALSAARAAAATVEQEAEAAYTTLASTEERLKAASLKAQRAVWSGDVQQYKAAVKRLVAVLDDAMVAEAEVVRLHLALAEMFPRSADGWLVSPDGDVRLAFGGFGKTRRLVPQSHVAWHDWVVENILDVGESAARIRNKAAEVRDALRAMAGA